MPQQIPVSPSTTSRSECTGLGLQEQQLRQGGDNSHTTVRGARKGTGIEKNSKGRLWLPLCRWREACWKEIVRWHEWAERVREAAWPCTACTTWCKMLPLMRCSVRATQSNSVQSSSRGKIKPKYPAWSQTAERRTVQKRARFIERLL